MNADRHYLEALAAQGKLTPEGLEFALGQLGCLPAGSRWRHFADRLLLAAGCLLILAGVVCFFAFNWKELHRFVKLALIAAPLVTAALLAARQGVESANGQAWLGGASVLTGILLATAGQIYQSGADSELLFFAWAALILPWVLLGRAPWLWLFWLLLVNTAVALAIVGRFDVWALFWLQDAMFWVPMLLNLAAAAVWEVLWPRLSWLRATYGPRLLALAGGGAATFLTSYWWFMDRHDSWQTLHYTPFAYALWLGTTLWYYQQGRRDLVPLAIGALSVIIVATAGMTRGLVSWHGDVGSFLLICLVVVGMTALAAIWLRGLNRRWHEEGAHE